MLLKRQESKKKTTLKCQAFPYHLNVLVNLFLTRSQRLIVSFSRADLGLWIACKSKRLYPPLLLPI